jgi:16S rRNA (adenine1518-N6/adenine1519-N6)-dimethyltransferase
MFVKPKKFLGQHFLNDIETASKIVDSLEDLGFNKVLEIGPGTGVLTQFLLKRDELRDFEAVEIDSESVEFLKANYPKLKISHQDFLELDFKDTPCVGLIGNLPYNISSLILFKVFENEQSVVQSVFMLQKEVAERVAAKPNSKANGVLSILLQAFYSCEYLFTVGREHFTPPPKVLSGVVRLTRNSRSVLPCNPSLFKKVVKTAFNQRRKTLRNALSSLVDMKSSQFEAFAQRRAEQLNVEEFFELTNLIENVTQT